LGLALIQEGNKATIVANVLNVHRTTVNEWINCFEKVGLEGLYDRKRKGRKCAISGREKEFKDMVIKLQQERVGGRIIAKDIQVALEKQFGTYRSTDQIYQYLEKVGLVWISSRSKNPKSSKEK
jgi:transposase